MHGDHLVEASAQSVRQDLRQASPEDAVRDIRDAWQGTHFFRVETRCRALLRALVVAGERLGDRTADELADDLATFYKVTRRWKNLRDVVRCPAVRDLEGACVPGPSP